jgi:hypothetical protein
LNLSAIQECMYVNTKEVNHFLCFGALSSVGILWRADFVCRSVTQKSGLRRILSNPNPHSSFFAVRDTAQARRSYELCT